MAKKWPTNGYALVEGDDEDGFLEMNFFFFLARTKRKSKGKMNSKKENKSC